MGCELVIVCQKATQLGCVLNTDNQVVRSVWYLKKELPLYGIFLLVARLGMSAVMNVLFRTNEWN